MAGGVAALATSYRHHVDTTMIYAHVLIRGTGMLGPLDDALAVPLHAGRGSARQLAIERPLPRRVSRGRDGPFLPERGGSRMTALPVTGSPSCRGLIA